MFVTALSLSLTGILLLCVSAYANSVDVKEMAQSQFGDRSQYLLQYEDFAGREFVEMQKENPLGQSLREELAALPGVDMDEYVPEEPQEPSGRYWTGRDETGQPKIYFDDRSPALETPKQPGDTPDAKKADADPSKATEPDSAGGGAKGTEKKEELCACNTDKVDGEIENLKKKQQELTQRLNTETDEAKIQDLERQLAQVEQELKQKDGDTYRRQNSTFTQLS